MDVLKGEEFTIECFTTHDNQLIYVNPRKRTRVRMGTSLSFSRVDSKMHSQFFEIAKKINALFNITGPWYFQVKFKDVNHSTENFKILEISTRLAGSSVWSRANGVNISELALWDNQKIKVSTYENSSSIILERYLESKMTLVENYSHVYIDLDNTILVNGVINHWAVAFLLQEINNGRKIHLITKSLETNLNNFLAKMRILGFFDTVIHLQISDEKFKFIDERNAIFIDDSYTERLAVSSHLGIPCFGPEVIPLMVN
jgi:hypothetical protein